MRGRGWLRILLWSSFLLGGLWRVGEYRAWTSLSGYRVETDNPAVEKRLWEVFPSRCLTFWPYLLKDAEGFGEFLERDIPVQVSTRMSGLGKFETTIKELEPWLKVEWQGKLWYISREGRMWEITGSAPALKGPVWRVPQGETEEAQAPREGVFQAPIPTDVIARFVDEYRGYSWFKSASEIALARRAGADLFRLKLERGSQKFEVVIQSAKYAGQDWGAAIDEILSRLSREEGDHLIDATYEGKILLRGLSSVPKPVPARVEGSRE